MKKNKSTIIIAALSLVLLSGCKETSELYNAYEYMTPYFERNYYKNDVFSDATINEAFELSSDKYFNGDFVTDFKVNSSITRVGAKTKYPEMFRYKNGETTSTLDGFGYTMNHANEDEKYIGNDFGRTKCMGKQDSSFQRGILSKLYDGQMFCYNYHSAALVETSASGFGHKFSKELIEGEYFLLSMRGGSTRGEGRITSIDLSVTFYKETSNGFEGTKVTLNEVYERTDSGGESCSFVGFKFSDALPNFDIKDICGYRIGFTNLHDGTNNDSVEPENESEHYWGLLIYELMFVNASWR